MGAIGLWDAGSCWRRDTASQGEVPPSTHITQSAAPKCVAQRLAPWSILSKSPVTTTVSEELICKSASYRSQESQTRGLLFSLLDITPGWLDRWSGPEGQLLCMPDTTQTCPKCYLQHLSTAHTKGFTSTGWTFYWAHATHRLAAKHSVPLSHGLYKLSPPHLSKKLGSLITFMQNKSQELG